MEDHRPDPDKLLEQLQADESRQSRGNLKIFFGYVAGVGKTYAMLEAAQRLAAAGVDVVAGYVEPHGRPETEVLLEGLEVLPPLSLEYRGLTLHEFDLDAALDRHPQLLLVDELAHTNAPGARHAKRWQDVQELLDAGINVYTTLNVQHLESLNDVIAQITGVQVRETVPDAVFDDADSVEVVDLPPRELVERLHQGKVYIPAQAERAMQGFFTGPNLGALREITLRRTADRVHAHLETARLAAAGPLQTWAITETLLVCVGPSPTSAKVIRTSKRMAASLERPLDRRGRRELPRAGRRRLAPSSAHEEHPAGRTPGGGDGDPQRGRHRRRDRQLRPRAERHQDRHRQDGRAALEAPRSREHRGRAARAERRHGCLRGPRGARAGARRLRQRRPRRGRRPGTATSGRWLACVARLWWPGRFQDIGLAEANKAIVFLLAVALVAARFGLGPGILATVLGVLAFDFFFVPPYLTFAVADAQYVITFAVMLVVALIISTLAARLRRQIRTARARERRLEALYRLEPRAVGGLRRPSAGLDRPAGGVAPCSAPRRPSICPTRRAGWSRSSPTAGAMRRRLPRAGGGDMGVRPRPARRQRHGHAARAPPLCTCP